MTYAVTILRRAQKELAGIPDPQFERICTGIRACPVTRGLPAPAS